MGKRSSPRDQMRTLHDTEFMQFPNSSERYETMHISPIRPPRIRVFDVREPFRLRWHLRQQLKFSRR